MSSQKYILWYGESPTPGVDDRLQKRGFEIILNPENGRLDEGLLGSTWIAVINHQGSSSNDPLTPYKQLPKFIDHGIFTVVVVNDRAEQLALQEHLTTINPDYPWDAMVRFIPNWVGVHFDIVVTFQPRPKWHFCEIVELDDAEKLTPEERLLVIRAFQKAEYVKLREIKGGYSESRVFMAYEKRRQQTSSIAHITQPRLVKIGKRKDLADEAAAMLEVSPFVPFELRPNLEVCIEGFLKAIYVADFVDKSESLYDAARAGRAETAISNLFNRTLQRWRDRGRQCARSTKSLASAAEGLEIIRPSSILKDYTESESVQKANLDISHMWDALKGIEFSHRAATIHGDLHGDNVRVRGDDAILIDLGSVKGKDEPGQGAPLCFDVAMLEVALVFGCNPTDKDKDVFHDTAWEREVAQYYHLDVITNAPDALLPLEPDSWLFGCLQRIRAFGIYDQSDEHEYAIALVIAMWRLCKFRPRTNQEKGRRVFALITGARILQQVLDRRGYASP